MHVVAAKAVCFQEAMKPEFRQYQQQIVRNAKALADAMAERGYHIVSGGTDNHLFLVDLRKNFPDMTGKVAQQALEKANITCNRNTVPEETRSPFQTSGLRIGSPAVTSRGMNESEMTRIAEAIDTVLRAPKDEDAIEQASAIVRELTGAHPLPY